MTHPPRNEAELRRLFSRVSDGLATQSEIAWLDLALQADEPIRQVFLEFKALQAGLYEHACQWAVEADGPLPVAQVDYDAVFATTERPVVFDRQKSDEPGWSRQVSAIRHAWNLAARGIQWHLHPVRFVTVIAMLTVAMWGVWLLIIRPGEPPVVKNRPASSGHLRGAHVPTVARLVRTVGAKWQDTTGLFFDGMHLARGRTLRLQSGLAKVAFHSGTEIILEGPAELQVDGENRCVLAQGALVAHVPRPARGFLVQTPTADFIDLGTEFGAYSDGQRSVIKVFQGQVAVQAHQVEQRLRLTAGEAAQVVHSDDRTPAQVVRLRDRKEISKRFVRRLPAQPPRVVAKYTLGRPGVFMESESWFAPVSSTDLVEGATHQAGENTNGVTLKLSQLSEPFDHDGGVSDGQYHGGPKINNRYTTRSWTISSPGVKTATYNFSQPCDLRRIEVYASHHSSGGIMDVLIEVDTGTGWKTLVDAGRGGHRGETQLAVFSQPAGWIAQNVARLRFNFDLQQVPNHITVVREIDVFGQPSQPVQELERSADQKAF